MERNERVDMTTSPQSAQPAAQSTRRRLKVTDLIIAIIFVLIVAILAVVLLRQLSLKHEVSDARVTANRVLSDLQKQDANDMHNLGDKTFQSSHSTAELQQLSENATTFVSGPSIIINQAVTNDSKGQKVDFVYKFTPNKKPYYIGIVVNKLKGSTSWHLISLSGNSDQSALPK